jgi:hypothetical protein
LEFKIEKNTNINEFIRNNPYHQDFITPLFKFENNLTGFVVLKSNSLEKNVNKLNEIQKYFNFKTP